MTEQITKIINPAWDAIKELPRDTLLDMFGPEDGTQIFQPASSGWMVNGEHRAFSDIRNGVRGEFVGYRSRITSFFTWAIPAPESLTFMVEALDGRPVVEVGAGSGYWAWMLSQLDVDVVAYDAAPVGHDDSWFHKSERNDEAEPVEFYPVKQGSIEVLADHADRALFLCWPNYGSSFAYDAVKAYQGDMVVYIGEEQGCNADDDFFALMDGLDGLFAAEDVKFPEQEWQLAGEGPMISWSGIYDRLRIYERKAQ